MCKYNETILLVDFRQSTYNLIIQQQMQPIDFTLIWNLMLKGNSKCSILP